MDYFETLFPMSPWTFLVLGYVLTVAIEAPIIWWGLSRRHSNRTKLLAVFGLTAATYPIVVLVLPTLLENTLGHIGYLIVAETFAPLAEWALFRFVVCQANERPHGAESQPAELRDAAAIVSANAASFVVGLVIFGV